jgi:hypothetical protein
MVLPGQEMIMSAFVGGEGGLGVCLALVDV